MAEKPTHETARRRRAVEQYHRDQRPDLIEMIANTKAERDALANRIALDVSAGLTPDRREVSRWREVADRYKALGDLLLAEGRRERGEAR